MASPTTVFNPSAPSTLTEQLKRDEGYRRFPYKDSRGKLTIGYGFNLTDDGLSETESYLVLSYRQMEVKTTLVKTVHWVGSLDAARQDALANMAYNMGIQGLLLLKNFMALCEAGNWEAASDDLLGTEYAREVGARAQRLAVQLRTGVRQ